MPKRIEENLRKRIFLSYPKFVGDSKRSVNKDERSERCACDRDNALHATLQAEQADERASPSSQAEQMRKCISFKEE